MRWLVLLLLLAGPVFAVQPDEVLDDPVLEERARDISGGLRCLVCRNESIDESNAPLARDLRLLVRERLVAGDSDAETVAFITERFGEYVLLKPQTGGSNWILWGAGPAMLLVALLLAALYMRGRSTGAEAAPLTAEEEARLRKVLAAGDSGKTPPT
ncbi:cytochrome c-type biogenesis protein CcmH [Poseidonocella pacifica]|uniref:Cytochrome c-type biogenesis protein n=1 Tax=Poseidonocella pacifica TaxID=871651 RepID=A0A1I0VS65_9RHOB|nr:cytochrome c-type biogenesis protein [Poseidonocella pacifica]SFA78867.1 cytochrome c-type biogenesis protein CcmH [Poseidonocella pacifica]